MESILQLFQYRLAVIRRRHLIGRHTGEDGVRPTTRLTSLLLILCQLLSCSTTGTAVMAVEDTPVEIGRHEINEGNDGKDNDCQHIQKVLLVEFHYFF